MGALAVANATGAAALAGVLLRPAGEWGVWVTAGCMAVCAGALVTAVARAW